MENKNKGPVRVNFFISKDQKEKLENIAKALSPPGIKLNLSETIRLMIESYDPELGKKSFFKKKE